MPSNPSTLITDGRQTVTTAGTRVRLSATSVSVKEVLVQAELDNTGVVVVGGSTVVAALATRRGITLNPGDVVTLDFFDLTDVWIDSMVNTDGVTYVALAGGN